jgi:hypothetical protein
LRRREIGNGLLTEDQNWWKTETFEHYASKWRQDDSSQTQKLTEEKQATWGLFLPELTKPWRRPRLPEQKENPTKKGPAGAPGGRENQAIWQWQEHLRSISKKWQNRQHTQATREMIYPLKSKPYYNRSTEVTVIPLSFNYWRLKSSSWLTL